MNYEIKISGSGKYVLVKVYASMTRELAQEIAPKADEIGMEHNIKNLMFDLRESRNIENVQTNVTFTNEDLPSVENSYFEKVANLVRHDDSSHSLVIVALANKGFNIRMFRNENDALDWMEDRVN